MAYARDNAGTLEYPSAEEFAGIPNYMDNEPALRRAGYLPLVGEAEAQDGYTAFPATWHMVQQSEVRTEPRQTAEDVYEEDPETHEQIWIGTRTIMRDTEVEFDTSYIAVDTWDYTPDPEPPEPIVRYSKYAIKLACESRGLWEQVRTAIEQSGKWESFLLIQDIASNNAELVAVMPSIVATFGQELVNEVLAESIIQTEETQE